MLSLDINIGPITRLRQGLGPALREEGRQAAQQLAVMMHAHVVERVQTGLRSRREQYLQALQFTQESPDMWILSLDRKAIWIEEGLPPGFSLLDGLLRSRKAKMAKDGSIYTVVPFEHNKGGPASQTPAQQGLVSALRAEMKSRGIPWARKEMGPGGQPKLGFLHGFNVWAPAKTHEGPGQGHGPIGAPRQGPTGIPWLHGVRVYQHEVPGKMGQKGTVKRSVMTFRIASSKHRGQGNRWVHPGLEPKLFLDEAMHWGQNTWDQDILPQVLKKLQDRL